MLTIALAAILMALAFVPAVQTWVARMEINRQPGWQGSVGAFSAGFGRLDVADLHLEYGGAVLTLPRVHATLPLTTAAWDRKLLVRSLVAKGWTLDLSRIPIFPEVRSPSGPAPGSGAAGGSRSAAAAGRVQMMMRALGGILSRWNPSGEMSLDGIELEGDVLVAGPQAGAPLKAHVTIKGGGMAPASEGVLAIDAEGVGLDAKNRPVEVAGHGRLAVTMTLPRTLGRIAMKANLSIKGGSFLNTVTLSADAVADRGAHEEICTLDLGTGDRRLATVFARHSGGTGRLEGTWKVDLQDSDLAPFAPERRAWPAFTAAGEGSFDAVPDFTRVHALGRLTAAASHWDALAPALARIGSVTLDTRFDLAHSGQILRIGRLSVSVTGEHPVALVQSVQPFDFDERTGQLTPADPGGDWMKGSVQALPVDWFSGLTDGLTFAGAAATGEFVARVANGGFSVRPTTPLTSSGVSVKNADRILAQGLDLSLSLRADHNLQGWQVQWAPFTVAGGDRRWATIEGQASRPAGRGEPIAVTGTWTADLEALAAQPGIPAIRWIKGRSASGDFSARIGDSTKIEGKLVVAGHRAEDSLAANVSAEVGAAREVRFHAPIRIATGSGVSEVAVDGMAAGKGAGSRIDVTLSGTSASLEHLRLLAAPLIADEDAPLSAGPPSGSAGNPVLAAARDRRPFWGDWTGPVAVAFDRLRAGGRDFNYVRGTFNVGHQSIRLEQGLLKLFGDKLTNVEGSLSFDPAAASPYSLKATASLGEIDAAPLLAATPPQADPVITGRFSVAGTLTGTGLNLDDLLGRTREEFRLTSRGGAFRLLRTKVADALPEPPASPVADALDPVRSAVGSFFHLKPSPSGSGVIRLNKNTEAVLNFTYGIAEFSYSELTLTAIREADGTIRLADLAMTAADEHLTGSGRITPVNGLSFRAQPLSLDLQLGARNAIAGFLSEAGLLSSQKDSLGYALLDQPIHLAGTLDHIDDTQWRDLLVRAATRKPDAGNKKSPATTPRKD